MKPRRRLLVVAATLIALLAAGLGVLLLRPGGGSADGGSARADGALRWAGKPKVFPHDTLPHDSVLQGKVRNDSLRAVEIPAADLVLRDAKGRRVQAAPVFLEAFTHGLLPSNGNDDELPKAEVARLGRLAALAPGATAPLTIAWRDEPGGSGPPVRIDYGSGSLPLRASP